MKQRTFYFKDVSGTVWKAEEYKDGSVWIRVPECDNDFDNVKENGYTFASLERCMHYMPKWYGDFNAYFGENYE